MKKSDLNKFISVCRDIFLQESVGNLKAQKFLTEATDYEIAHLAIKGKLPVSYSNKTDCHLVEQISYLQEINTIDHNKLFGKLQDKKFETKHPYLSHLSDKLHHMGSEANEFLAKHHPTHHQEVIAGGVALAAAGIAGAYALYKHYINSNSHHATTHDKAKKIKQNGRKIQLASLHKSLSMCSKSKNPNACRKILQDKIHKVSKKI